VVLAPVSDDGGMGLQSDPLLRRFEELAISVYYPAGAAPAGHLANLEISPSGNHAAESLWPQGERAQSPGLASGVDTEEVSPEKVLVAFGVSITEGVCATEGTHRDYPERLSVLLTRRILPRPVRGASVSSAVECPTSGSHQSCDRKRSIERDRVGGRRTLERSKLVGGQAGVTRARAERGSALRRSAVEPLSSQLLTER
jgi:hypothetical protein